MVFATRYPASLRAACWSRRGSHVCPPVCRCRRSGNGPHHRRKQAICAADVEPQTPHQRCGAGEAPPTGAPGFSFAAFRVVVVHVRGRHFCCQHTLRQTEEHFRRIIKDNTQVCEPGVDLHRSPRRPTAPMSAARRARVSSAGTGGAWNRSLHTRGRRGTAGTSSPRRPATAGMFFPLFPL